MKQIRRRIAIARALIRYLAADALRAERWVAPAVLFLMITVAGTAAGGSARSCYGLTAAALMPIALWLSVSVSNSEDPVQTAITVVTVGSSLAVRVAKLATAYLVCLGLTVIGVGWPLLTGHPAAVTDVPAGVIAHLLTALAGAAFGSGLSRPVLRAPAWVVLFGLGCCLLEFLVPGVPPVRAIATRFTDDGADPGELFGALLVIGAQTVLLSIVVVGSGYALTRRRT